MFLVVMSCSNVSHLMFLKGTTEGCLELLQGNNRNKHGCCNYATCFCILRFFSLSLPAQMSISGWSHLASISTTQSQDSPFLSLTWRSRRWRWKRASCGMTFPYVFYIYSRSYDLSCGLNLRPHGAGNAAIVVLFSATYSAIYRALPRWFNPHEPLWNQVFLGTVLETTSLKNWFSMCFRTDQWP